MQLAENGGGVGLILWLPPQSVPHEEGDPLETMGHPLPIPSRQLPGLYCSPRGEEMLSFVGPPIPQGLILVLSQAWYLGGMLLGGGTQELYLGGAAQGAEAADSHCDTRCLEGITLRKAHAYTSMHKHTHVCVHMCVHTGQHANVPT